MNPASSSIGSRMWLLMLLDGTERHALAPLAVARVHRLVYLANAMAPVYDLPTPDGYILKNQRGPFFPAVQWDLDRMTAQGLVTVRSSRRVRDRHGWRLDAEYGLSPRGARAVDTASTLDIMAQKGAFLREVVRAFASMDLQGADQDSSLLRDVGYAYADDQEPVDFRTAERNLTALAAARIGRGTEGREERSRREKVHLYFRYLERVWVKDNEGARVA